MTAPMVLIQSQYTSWVKSEIVGQMAAPAHQYRNPTCTEPLVGSLRVRIEAGYMSQNRESRKGESGNSEQPNEATGPAIPPHIVGRARQVGLSRVRYAAQNRRALDNPTRQAQQTEIGGMAGIDFLARQKNQQFSA